MVNRAYNFEIRVKLPDKSNRDEDMTVLEHDNKVGAAMALGKVVRYYDSLKAYKVILDYRVNRVKV